MKITVAKTAGFCMGVQRAVHLAVESSSSDQEKVYTIGPLIHNRQALELLESRGIRELTAENEETNKPGQVLIRAHGIPPEQEKEYRDKGHTIVDGTCPRVKTVHRVIEEYREQDYTILICGDHGHAEVEGLMGYAGDNGIIVNTPEDIDNLDKDNTDRVCLVSQTTFSIEGFEEIAERLRKRFPEKEVKIKKTICAATKQRQEEVTRLSNKVDTMIVVGGKNSANTKRLAELAADTGIPVQHIETEKDIDSRKFKRDTHIGVTAGASTPEWMINRTVEYLQQIDRRSRASIKGFFSNSVETLSALNIPFAAAGAAFFSASSILQKMEVNTLGLIITFLYLIAVYLWNSLTNLEMTKHHGVRRYTLYS
ncbi:MAG: 4-hydroxy-3-methylbut-2-enyl diphosphate reductase, partial [Chitinivibrionales bacterium]